MKFDDISNLSHTTWECKYHIVIKGDGSLFHNYGKRDIFVFE